MSRPIALATSDTFAPVASQMALMALILEIRWARKALAACKEQCPLVFSFQQNILPINTHTCSVIKTQNHQPALKAQMTMCWS